MRREWEPEDLIACWTLVEDDWRLVANKRGGSRLAFAGLATFFYARSTAQPWQDTINPVTGTVYTNEAEYRRVMRMTPAEIEAARNRRRAPATDPGPAIDPPDGPATPASGSLRRESTAQL
jgi:hypothetical protein